MHDRGRAARRPPGRDLHRATVRGARAASRAVPRPRRARPRARRGPAPGDVPRSLEREGSASASSGREPRCCRRWSDDHRARHRRPPRRGAARAARRHPARALPRPPCAGAAQLAASGARRVGLPRRGRRCRRRDPDLRERHSVPARCYEPGAGRNDLGHGANGVDPAADDVDTGADHVRGGTAGDDVADDGTRRARARCLVRAGRPAGACADAGCRLGPRCRAARPRGAPGRAAVGIRVEGARRDAARGVRDRGHDRDHPAVGPCPRGGGARADRRHRDRRRRRPVGAAG